MATGKPLPDAQQRIVDGLTRGERIVFRLGRYDTAPEDNKALPFAVAAAGLLAGFLGRLIWGG